MHFENSSLRREAWRNETKSDDKRKRTKTDGHLELFFDGQDTTEWLERGVGGRVVALDDADADADAGRRPRHRQPINSPVTDRNLVPCFSLPVALGLIWSSFLWNNSEILCNHSKWYSCTSSTLNLIDWSRFFRANLTRSIRHHKHFFYLIVPFTEFYRVFFYVRDINFTIDFLVHTVWDKTLFNRFYRVSINFT